MTDLVFRPLFFSRRRQTAGVTPVAVLAAIAAFVVTGVAVFYIVGFAMVQMHPPTHRPYVPAEFVLVIAGPLPLIIGGFAAGGTGRLVNRLTREEAPKATETKETVAEPANEPVTGPK